MALNTDFNVSPYYDDYDEEKNFHRVLFRPAVPIQARELTQLQTILQNQVERFGDNIYRQGTIIKGCCLSFDFSFHYVKIEDLQVDGQRTLVSDYANSYLKDSANLTSEVVNFAQGLESQNPDLSTLFIKYINTGTASKKKYANTDVLTVFARDFSIQSIAISAAGTLYSNSDVIVFTSNSGTGASANVVTFANGSISDVVISDGGSGYLTAPTLTITTTTGTSGALTALNYIAQVRVANSSYTAPVGVGSAVRTTDGVIYQKGHFVRVEDQLTIVDKYSNAPTDISLGFSTEETIVNNSVESTLLDNAQGYSNYTAPGAHRLKLTANLVATATSNAASNSEFFTILEFQNGSITKRRTGTEFNSVASELSRRTREESGNYVVNQFNLYTEEISGNTTHLNLAVSPGIAYVDGFRSELTGTVRVPVRKSSNTITSNNQSISTNFGNYVQVDELLGNFDFTAGTSINLRDVAGDDISDNFGGDPTSPGSIIGTARIKSLVYESGAIGSPSCIYRLYLFDIKMQPGKSFSSIRSVQVSGGVADVVLDTGSAVLKETSFDSLIFDSGTPAVSFFEDEQFIYRNKSTVSILSSGVATLSLTGNGEVFPYTVSSTLNDTQEKDFIVVPAANAHSTTNLTGTVSTSGNVITGTSTSFISELDVDDYIKFGSNTSYFRVGTITSDTAMTVYGVGPSPTLSSNTFAYAFPKNVPIRLDRGSANVAIDSNGNTATFFVGNTISGTTSATVYSNVKVNGASPKLKSVVKDVYVKLSTAKLTETTKGPWCLGIPDVLDIVAVYVGSSNTYSNTTTNQVKNFELITGQNDNYYGLSFIRKKPGSSLSLTSSSNLLVRVNLFTHGTGSYLSTESYPVDDTTSSLPSDKIRTQSIPYHISPKTNRYYNLRDSIDFRPITANTANAAATTVAGATVDPTSTETLTGSIFFPTPNEEFQADIVHYLSRVDTIVITPQSSVSVVEGIPSLTPVPPRAPDGTMKLGTVVIPPFPSLSPQSALAAKRNEYSTKVSHDQVKGYTMKDIKFIEDRINRLEYYSLFNTLESSVTNLVIPSESNTAVSRFKNGFFAESFNSYEISNVNDPEYTILVDTKTSTARPQIEKNRISFTANTSASSNVTFKGEYGIIDFTEVEFLNQPIANKTRNPVQTAWSFKGLVSLFPRYDDYYDIEKGAVNVTIDLATPLNQLVNAINDNVAFKKDTTQINVNLGSITNVTPPTESSEGLDQRTVTSTTTTVTNSFQPGGTLTNTQQVGEFLTDFGMNAFIRPQWVTFVAVGLRPETEHFVFFDKVNVSSQTRPATVSNIETMDPRGLLYETTASWTGPKGSSLISSSTGTLVGAFYIESETFFVGERAVTIADNSDYNSTDESISVCRTTFNAYNFYKNSSTLTVTTKTPTSVVASSNTSVDIKRTVESIVVPRLPSPPSIGFLDNMDPIAQTFNINEQNGSDGVFLTKVDLFFKTKSSTLGVTVQIRETENGYPSSSILSQKVLKSSSVSVSNNGSSATTVTFDSPIYLKSGSDYSIVVRPDQDNPDYEIWTAATGVPDLVNTSLISNKNWGGGVMFLSSNDRAWTPVQTEDFKFKVYIANFTKTSATLVLENDPYEFLTVSNTSGSFVESEEVAQKSNTYLTGSITANTSSLVVNTTTSQTGSLTSGDYVLVVYANSASVKTGTVTVGNTSTTNVTGSGTDFVNEYDPGDYILINGNVREITATTNATHIVIDGPLSNAVSSNAHSGVTDVIQISRVSSVNSSSITLKDFPYYVIDGGTTYHGAIQKVVRGTIDVLNNDGTIVIRDSNASNSTFKFEASKNIVGELSQAKATITSVDNKTVNFTEPYFRYISPPTTSVSLIQKIDGVTATAANTAMAEGISNPLRYEGQLKSRSNEITSGSKSFKIFANLTRANTFNSISPAVDIAPISAVTLLNIINNDNTDETTRYGNSKVRYISKNVVLADGLDAEDMKVYVTAYKPSTSDIYVYTRVLAADDNTVFEDRDWTLLNQVTESNLYSDSLNENDYIEYEYTFPQTPPSTLLTGVVTSSSNTTLTGAGTTFNSSLVANDVVKIVQGSTLTSYDLGVVDSVTNSTHVVLKSNTSFSGSASVEKVTQPGAAFKYNRDDNIVNYLDVNRGQHSKYKTFAIKVVLTSSSTKFVPILADVRALAVSI
jgi:hypothetical protein